VYTTLLSIVPLLALSFSVLKAFGVYNQVEPMLAGLLEPLGEKGAEITARIIDFIRNMNVGVLGSVGLAMLVYTAVSLIQKIEESFNYIWHVSRPRRMGERFSRYLSFLLVAPLLIFSAMGITASAASAGFVAQLTNVEPLGQLFLGLTRLMPYLLVIGAFTFAYLFIPNTRVKPAAALFGGGVAGVLWQTAGWAFAEFAASAGSYTAIYSSFAILILFMIWLYLSWLILLLGASVAFYHQRPEYLVPISGEPRLSNRMREQLALSALSRIAGRFFAAQPALSIDELTRGLGVPLHTLQVVLQALERAGLLSQSWESSPTYLPACDWSRVPLARALDAVRAAGEDRFLTPTDLPVMAKVSQIVARLDESRSGALDGLSIADLADLDPEAAGRQ
jgi:membrane protein